MLPSTHDFAQNGTQFMRMRPLEIEVPADNPFANDHLDRHSQVEAIASILNRIDGPFVLAVDAPWGEGKTTFLRMTTAYLRKDNFLVADFNAWETDFCGDPFIALTTELIQDLERQIGEDGKSGRLSEATGTEMMKAIGVLKKQSLQVTAIRLARVGSKVIAPFAAGIDIASVLEAMSGKEQNLGEARTDNYGEQKRLMRDFTLTLTKLGAATVEHTGRPLVVLIDELDRCRPTYAIELLETVKHLFSVEGVTFILGVNRGELAHSVRGVYGERFNAEKYLSRFIDIDIDLPRPQTDRLVDSIMKEVDIEKSLVSNQMEILDYDGKDTSIIKEFLASSELSIRDIVQSIHHLGLILASLPSDYYALLPMTVILLTLRTADRDLYSRFIRGEATDEDVVNNFFSWPSLRTFVNTHKGAYIEAHVLLACMEVLHGPRGWSHHGTPLAKKYQRLTERAAVDAPETRHAFSVINFADIWRRKDVTTNPVVDLRVIISRSEMFAKSMAER